MNDLARRVQRVYLTLLLGNTLAASFIWGINTLFLLDAGLSNLEAFAANAFFTAGMVLFDIPTGVVADVWGRRTSYLLGTLTLSASTFLYWLLWETKGPFWAWAIVSMLLGLGFTFFSGAVEAWLVDALHYAEYDGALEAVMGRGQMVAGAAMLGGSVAGGVIAQATNLGVPFLIRVGVLAAMFVVAHRLMRDLGFTPDRSKTVLHSTREVLDASLDLRAQEPAGALGDARRAVLRGSRDLHLLRAAAVPARPLRQPEGLHASPGSRPRSSPGRRSSAATSRPGSGALFRKRTTSLILGALLNAAILGALGLTHAFWLALAAARRLGAGLRRRDADPAGVPERHDPVAPARDRALVRLARWDRPAES